MHTPLPKRYQFVATHPPSHGKGGFSFFWKWGCACKIWWGKPLGKFGARAPWPTPIKSMHITHGAWQVGFPRGIGQRDPSMKEEKAKHTNNMHFQETLAKPWGKNMQKGGPPQQTQAHTHTKTNHPKRAFRKSKWKKAWHQHKPKQPNTM